MEGAASWVRATVLSDVVVTVDSRWGLDAEASQT